MPDPRLKCLRRLAEGDDGYGIHKHLHDPLDLRDPNQVRLLPEQVEWAALRAAKSMLQVWILVFLLLTMLVCEQKAMSSSCKRHGIPLQSVQRLLPSS